MARPSSSKTPVDRRADELDTIAAVLPIDRRDELAELLTDQDIETLRHLVNEASRHESVGSVRLLRTYGDHAARIDVSRRNGL
ncbi:hypothetical protein ACQKGC_27360, partial [Allorhizobium pseudoryzae]